MAAGSLIQSEGDVEDLGQNNTAQMLNVPSFLSFFFGETFSLNFEEFVAWAGGMVQFCV